MLKMLEVMKQDFARFDESIQRARQRLAQTEAELDGLESRARKIMRTMNSLEGEKESAE